MALPVLFPLRPVDGAVVSISSHPHRRRRVTIDHRPLADVTPPMLLDWFRNLGGTMVYGDQAVDRYHAWHPLDHITWELARPAPTGGAAEGARFRMVEAFGARPEFAIDEVARVEKLDETGIRLVKRVGGVVLPAGAHLVGRRRRRSLRDGDGPGSSLGAVDAAEHRDRPALPGGEDARLGATQHRRGRPVGASATGPGRLR